MTRALLTLFVLAAAIGAQPVSYNCPSGESLRVTYTQAERGPRVNRIATAMLEIDGKPTLMLPQVPAASGAQYTDGYTVLWNRGTDLSLDAGTLRLSGCTTGTPASGAASETFTGMMQYSADAALLTLCSNNQRYPIATEGAYRDLEAAYRRDSRWPGAPMLVTVRGRVAQRASSEASRGQVPTLIVDTFISASPEGTCSASSQAVPNGPAGRWTMIEMDGTSVSLSQPPTIEFDVPQNRVSGFAGCNRYSARFESASGSMRITQGTSTRMACATQAMRLESDFLRLLDRTAKFEQSGDQISFFDSNNEAILRFKRQ